jgi:hypothetical protein
MEDQQVQILVHIAAPCTPRDDTRYRQQAHGLLSFIRHGERAGTTVHTVLENEARSRPQGLFGNLRSHDAKQGMVDKVQRQETPAPNSIVQVGRTPAFRSKRTPLERSKTAPAVIKETPVAPYPGHADQFLRYETPPSTVLDSQPSHSSFKRAFIEAASLSSGSYNGHSCLQPPRKRARTESPKHSMREPWPREEPQSRSDSSGIQSSPPPAGVLLGLDGVREQSFVDSSPSPPKRSPKGCCENHTTSYSPVRDGKDQRPHRVSHFQGAIFEDKDKKFSYGPSPTEATDTPPQPSSPLQSSPSSHNRQYIPPPTFPNGSVDGTTTKSNSNCLTLAYAQHTSRLRVLPASELLTSAPRPPTSAQVYTTHLTSALSILRAQLQPLSKYYTPASQTRPIKCLERGFWHVTLPVHWPHALRATIWRRLRDHVVRGKAGFGTRLERILDGQGIGSSQGRVAAFRADDLGRESWRIWCWGEVHIEVWLLLYVDSARAIRGVEMVWCDGVEDIVVRM